MTPRKPRTDSRVLALAARVTDSAPKNSNDVRNEPVGVQRPDRNPALQTMATDGLALDGQLTDR